MSNRQIIIQVIRYNKRRTAKVWPEVSVDRKDEGYKHISQNFIFQCVSFMIWVIKKYLSRVYIFPVIKLKNGQREIKKRGY